MTKQNTMSYIFICNASFSSDYLNFFFFFYTDDKPILEDDNIEQVEKRLQVCGYFANQYCTHFRMTIKTLFTQLKLVKWTLLKFEISFKHFF